MQLEAALMALLLAATTAIGYFAGAGSNDNAVSNNICIDPSTNTSTTGVINSGSGATSGV